MISQIAMVALVVVFPNVQDPAIVSCTWESGEYPQHMLGNGPIGTYKISSSEFLSWRPDSRRWEPFGCHSSRFGGGCQQTVSETTYEHVEEFHEQGPGGRHGLVRRLTIDRTTGAATYFQRSYAFFGLSDDGDSQSILSGTCTKASDPSLQPPPRPIL